jgi:hypothetical protein
MIDLLLHHRIQVYGFCNIYLAGQPDQEFKKEFNTELTSKGRRTPSFIFPRKDTLVENKVKPCTSAEEVQGETRTAWSPVQINAPRIQTLGEN